MNVIAPRAIREFVMKYPESEVPLRTWYNNLRKQDFLNFANLTEHFVVDTARSKKTPCLFLILLEISTELSVTSISRIKPFLFGMF
jgi:mRNA-degrading endonuclease HigB of HigAB toxin-antitoxin module